MLLRLQLLLSSCFKYLMFNNVNTSATSSCFNHCCQVCVLDAKRYKELNPGNAPLGFDALSPCILDKHLLRWEAGSETAVVSLPLEYGQVCLSELQCFSISGEHRPGKACDYRCAGL